VSRTKRSIEEDGTYFSADGKGLVARQRRRLTGHVSVSVSAHVRDYDDANDYDDVHGHDNL